MLVRGMTLIHTVPIRLTARPVTINQDMKALIPNGDVDPLACFAYNPFTPCCWPW